MPAVNAASPPESTLSVTPLVVWENSTALRIRNRVSLALTTRPSGKGYSIRVDLQAVDDARANKRKNICAFMGGFLG